MNNRLSNEKAFTLIEVIVTLVIAGVIAVVAGMGLVRIAQGYVFVRQNTETVQKAQIAMARMAKELEAATSISTASLPTSKSITYTRPVLQGSAISNTNTITISGSLVTISINGGGTAYTLTNNVVYNSSSFKYYNSMGNQITTVAAANVPNIHRIDIALTLSGANGTPCTLNSSVFIQESFQ